MLHAEMLTYSSPKAREASLTPSVASAVRALTFFAWFQPPARKNACSQGHIATAMARRVQGQEAIHQCACGVLLGIAAPWESASLAGRGKPHEKETALACYARRQVAHLSQFRGLSGRSGCLASSAWPLLPEISQPSLELGA